MKRFLVFILTLSLLSPGLAEEVEIGAIPTSAGEFVTLRNQLASTPEGGAACFIAAMLAFSKSNEVGMQCLTLALDHSNIASGKVYKGFAPSSSIMYHVNRFNGYKVWPYVGFAYLKGATAANDYKIAPPYKVVTQRQRNSGSDDSGQVKIFVQVDGFRPRPITLKRNEKKVWKALECSSMFLNVSPPASSKKGDPL